MDIRTGLVHLFLFSLATAGSALSVPQQPPDGVPYVAILGAGVGGASTAHFLRQAVGNSLYLHV